MGFLTQIYLILKNKSCTIIGYRTSVSVNNYTRRKTTGMQNLVNRLAINGIGSKLILNFLCPIPSTVISTEQMIGGLFVPDMLCFLIQWDWILKEINAVYPMTNQLVWKNLANFRGSGRNEVVCWRIFDPLLLSILSNFIKAFFPTVKILKFIEEMILGYVFFNSLWNQGEKKTWPDNGKENTYLRTL